jgi:hypothetical protein
MEEGVQSSGKAHRFGGAWSTPSLFDDEQEHVVKATMEAAGMC